VSARDDFPELARIPQGIGVEYIEDAEDQAERALNEIDFLRRWRAEAVQVLDEWERVWEVAGRPGRLGVSKACAVAELLDDYRTGTDDQ
jgi:hypothetical protein